MKNLYKKFVDFIDETSDVVMWRLVVIMVALIFLLSFWGLLTGCVRSVTWEKVYFPVNTVVDIIAPHEDIDLWTSVYGYGGFMKLSDDTPQDCKVYEIKHLDKIFIRCVSGELVLPDGVDYYIYVNGKPMGGLSEETITIGE